MRPGYGTISNPLNVVDGFSYHKILPGHTVYFRGGTHLADLTASLQGTAENPIIVRPYPGERAIICGKYSDYAAQHITYIDLEFIADFPRIWDSPTADYDPMVEFGSVGGKMINCTLHDTSSVGVFHYFDLVYGCISYNHGETAPDRGHGHSLYIQNDDAGHLKLVKHSIFGRSAGYGVHGFATTTGIRNMRFQENVLLPGSAHLIGSLQSDDGITFDGNHCVQGPSLGYGEYDHTNLTCTNNIMCGLDIKDYTSGTISNNIIYKSPGAPDDVVSYVIPAGASTLVWDNNAYYNRNGKTNCFAIDGVGWKTLAQWQAAYGFDANSTITLDGSAPADSTHVYPNEYASISKRKGLVVIWNWTEAANVSVDLATIPINAGAAMKIVNCEDPLVDIINTTMPGNKVYSFPMTGHTVAQVAGWTERPSAFPVLSAFMVEAA